MWSSGQIKKQCCGSESGSTGSTCFWSSWIRIRILLSLSKYSKNNLDFYCFVTLWLFDFLSLKNDVKVPSKSKMQENFFKKISFLLASWRSMMKIEGSASGSESGSIIQRHGIRGSRSGSHTTMSWIRNSGNTVKKSSKFLNNLKLL